MKYARRRLGGMAHFWLTEAEIDHLTQMIGRLNHHAGLERLDTPADQDGWQQALIHVGLSLPVLAAAIAMMPTETADWLYRQTVTPAGQVTLVESQRMTLAELRRGRGHARDVAAIQIGISECHLRTIEAGTVRPTPVRLQTLADAYDVPLAIVAATWATSRAEALKRAESRKLARRHSARRVARIPNQAYSG